jgi:uncharacterized membrane protein
MNFAKNYDVYKLFSYDKIRKSKKVKTKNLKLIEGGFMAEEETPTKAPQTGGSAAGDDNLMAALSYLGILVIVPLLVKKDSSYVKSHAKQGLVLLIAEVIFGFVAWLLVFIPVIGWLIEVVVWLFFLIMIIMGVTKALSGETWEMPVFGKMADKFKF